MQDFLDTHQKSICLVVCENDVFYRKLCHDYSLPDGHIRVDYQERCLLDSWTRVIWLCLFKRSIVITEYPNAVPRIISLVTNSKLISVIYGIVTPEKLVKHQPSRLVNLVCTSLFADHYYVVRRQGTYNSLQLAHGSDRVSLVLGKSSKHKCIAIVDKCIWISQCWGEDGYDEIEKFQQSCLDSLAEKYLVEVILHPRDTHGKYGEKVKQYDGMWSFVNSLNRNGCPKRILGIASSAMLELHDMGLNVKRVQNNETISWANGLDDLATIPVMHIKDILKDIELG